MWLDKDHFLLKDQEPSKGNKLAILRPPFEWNISKRSAKQYAINQSYAIECYEYKTQKIIKPEDSVNPDHKFNTKQI